jgi:hypothetical protein
MNTQSSIALPVRAYLTVVAAVLAAACGNDVDFTFPAPDATLEVELFDLVTGPIDRASAYDIVAGEGRGFPRAVRVDQTDQWDVAFAMLDGVSVWLPRGFFEGLEVTSGVTMLEGTFDSIRFVPRDKEDYEDQEAVPIDVGAVYAVRSRNDPGRSIPCKIFGKIEVLSIMGDPARMRFRVYWNRNCDDTNVDTTNLDDGGSLL